jgi:NADPH2:quinone reductase
MTATMKAFGFADEQATSAAVFEIPVPEPQPGEIRVRVHASSVNGYDVSVASGMVRGFMEHRYPVVVGKDFSGVVDAVGEDLDAFSVGDEVVGLTPPSQTVDAVGTYAEFVVVPATGYIAAKPAGLDHEHAASVGLAAMTAFLAVDTVSIADGTTVLIVGATGGVGTYAVQLAAARRANIIATARRDEETWIRELGATEMVDYSGDVVAQVREAYPDGVDSLIVAVHVGDGFGALAGLVHDAGAIASTVGGPDDVGRDISVSLLYAQSDPAPFANVVQLAADGSLMIPVTKTYAFDQLPEALGLVGQRSSRGKVAITIT